jgi:hypothetical protein
MDLSAVWAKGPGGNLAIPYESNYYDISGYGEGAYLQYVDDDIASEW